MARKTSKR